MNCNHRRRQEGFCIHSILAKGLCLKQLSLESSQIESRVRKLLTFFYWAIRSLIQRGALLRKRERWFCCLFWSIKKLLFVSLLISINIYHTLYIYIFFLISSILPLGIMCMCKWDNGGNRLDIMGNNNAKVKGPSEDYSSYGIVCEYYCEVVPFIGISAGAPTFNGRGQWFPILQGLVR